MYESVALFAIASLILDIHRSSPKIRMIFGIMLLGFFTALPGMYPDELPYLSDLIYWNSVNRWFLYVFILGFSQLYFSFSQEHKISRIAIVILTDYCYTLSSSLADNMITTLLVLLLIFLGASVVYKVNEQYIKKILMLFLLTAAAFLCAGSSEAAVYVPVYSGIFLSALCSFFHKRNDLFFLSVMVVFLYHQMLR